MSLPQAFQQRRIPLNSGAGIIPAIGFGTLIPDPVKAKRAIKIALETGFRHLDCAELYRNEAVVGEVMREAFDEGMLRRDDLFITTKLWNNNHRPERVGPALDASLRRLQLDYVDCYLIHTPFAFPPTEEQHPRDAQGAPMYDPDVTLRETWQAMERLADDGRSRSIGLSDIRQDRLEEIVTTARIRPAVVQIESHPYLPEWDLLALCRRHGITLQAFAPLGHGMEPRVTDDPVIVSIARRLGRSPAQVALAWAVQRGTAVLTTSLEPMHIRENFNISPLPEEAMREMREQMGKSVRFNTVVDTGVPSFVPMPA